MVESIDILALRGIFRARLEGLAPLTILTGPNGCGKSTVLDALLIGASPSPGHAIGLTVKRRGQRNGASWLLSSDVATIALGVGGVVRSRQLRVDEATKDLSGPLISNGYPGPYRQVTCSTTPGDNTWLVLSETCFAADNHFSSALSHRDPHPSLGHVRLIEPKFKVPLVDTFSELARQGESTRADDALRSLVPGFSRLAILTDNEEPSLYVERDGQASIPLGLAGDGIQSFAQIALQLAGRDQGLALLEEPEAFQHPRSLSHIARAIDDAVSRGRQIVLTTHSLELIDALLDVSPPERLSLFNLRLDGGQITSGRYSGAQAQVARSVIEGDLR